MEGKPRWLRMTAALGLLLGVLGALASLAVAPFMAAASLSSEIETKSELLMLLERRAKDRDRLKRENDRLTAAGSQARALLEGETFGLTSANLQKRLVESVLTAGMTLRSIQSLDPINDGDLTSVSVRLVCRGTTEGMRTLLYNLESGEPFLFVDEVLAKTDRTTAEEGAREGGVELSVELKVTGFAAGKVGP